MQIKQNDNKFLKYNLQIIKFNFKKKIENFKSHITILNLIKGRKVT